MSLTLIRRPHDSDTDLPWLRADTWEDLALAIGVPPPEPQPDGTVLVRWPGDRMEIMDPPPTLPDLVKAWASHSMRWAVVSGTAPVARQVRGPDQALADAM